MKLIVNHSSMQPIYEQIVDQVKDKIMHGELGAGEALPSVRTLAKELKVSALTVKNGIRCSGGGRLCEHGPRQGKLRGVCEPEPLAGGEEEGSRS